MNKLFRLLLGSNAAGAVNVATFVLARATDHESGAVYGLITPRSTLRPAKPAIQVIGDHCRESTLARSVNWRRA